MGDVLDPSTREAAALPASHGSRWVQDLCVVVVERFAPSRFVVFWACAGTNLAPAFQKRFDFSNSALYQFLASFHLPV
jgi:hypothetical protein